MNGECELTLIPTKCTPFCQDKIAQFQAVVYSNERPKLPSGPKRSNSALKHILGKDDRPELDMKRVRYEIMKFGRSNLEGREREEADVEHAVSLGALPPKNKCINYKEVLQKKKDVKDSNQVQKHAVVKLKTKILKGKDSKKKVKGNKKGKGILESYGKPSSKKLIKKGQKSKSKN